jgi:hypothetical protein
MLSYQNGLKDVHSYQVKNIDIFPGDFISVPDEDLDCCSIVSK